MAAPKFPHLVVLVGPEALPQVVAQYGSWSAANAHAGKQNLMLVPGNGWEYVVAKMEAVQ